MRASYLEKTLLLTAGRLLGALSSFCIPIFLSRFLSVEDYGFYKLVMLVQATLMFVLPLGIDGSLLYFMRADSARQHIYAFNVTALCLLLASLAGVVLWGAAAPLGAWLHQPQLAEHMGSFVPFLIFSLASNHLQVYFVYQDRLAFTLGFEICGQVYKALVTLIGFWYWQSIDFVMLGLAFWAALQTIFLLFYDLKPLWLQRTSPRTLFAALKRQIKYGLPLGGSNLLVYLLDFDRLLISAFFGAKSFALYTVGCFQIPFVASIEATLADYMGLGMVEAKQKGDHEAFRRMWSSTCRLIFMVEIPLALFCACFAGAIIPTLYGSPYAASAGIFAIYSLIGLVRSERCDMAFRALDATKILLAAQFFYAALSLAALSIGAYFFGLNGAMLGKLLAHGAATLVKLWLFSRLSRTPLKALFDWKSLGLTLLWSLAAALALQFVFRPSEALSIVSLGCALGLYIIFLAAAFWWGSLLHAEEKAQIRSRLVWGWRQLHRLASHPT